MYLKKDDYITVISSLMHNTAGNHRPKSPIGVRNSQVRNGRGPKSQAVDFHQLEDMGRDSETQIKWVKNYH